MRMKKIFPVLIASTAAVIAVFVGVPMAAADDGDTVCVGVLLPGTYENVVVPPGLACFIAGSTINGNIKNYGDLRVEAPTTIRGSIEADPGHQRVFLNFS